MLGAVGIMWLVSSVGCNDSSRDEEPAEGGNVVVLVATSRFPTVQGGIGAHASFFTPGLQYFALPAFAGVEPASYRADVECVDSPDDNAAPGWPEPRRQMRDAGTFIRVVGQGGELVLASNGVGSYRVDDTWSGVPPIGFGQEYDIELAGSLSPDGFPAGRVSGGLYLPRPVELLAPDFSPGVLAVDAREPVDVRWVPGSSDGKQAPLLLVWIVVDFGCIGSPTGQQCYSVIGECWTPDDGHFVAWWSWLGGGPGNGGQIVVFRRSIRKRLLTPEIYVTAKGYVAEGGSFDLQ